MQVIADLQLHSRFSRAVSKEMTIPNIAAWARRKGIALVATGDWTHPMWFREIERDLEEIGNGLLKLRKSAEVGMPLISPRQGPNRESLTHHDSAKAVTGIEKTRLPADFHPDPLFLLATEVSCIYSQNGKGRRVHTLIWVPTIESARKISQEMTKRGCNLLSDGRPIIGLTSMQVAELVFSIEPKALIIAAHCWTPWFSLYGSMSGFNSIEEAFGPYAKQIYAVETGLSSNPSMNWLIKELDHRSIVSFSDAHSGPKLGREATVFDVDELSYGSIYQAIKEGNREQGIGNSSAPTLNPTPQSLIPHISYTIEFYPEEGKYHWSGHRACNIRWSPSESKKNGTVCPVCGKPLTQGVEQRVGELASRSESDLQLSAISYQLSDKTVIQMTKSGAFPSRPPFVMLVPLLEIIAEAVGSPVASPKVQTPYFRLTDEVGSEFEILLTSEPGQIAKVAGERVAEGVDRVRKGRLRIDPGYDGVFGVVKIWDEGTGGIVEGWKEQLSLLTEEK